MARDKFHYDSVRCCTSLACGSSLLLPQPGAQGAPRNTLQHHTVSPCFHGNSTAWSYRFCLCLLLVA